jgi:hypothetical protein
MLHEVIDWLSFLVTVLALISLFFDPAGERRQKFLKFGLLSLFILLLGFVGYEHWQNRNEELAHYREIRNKERLVIDALCRENEMNFEQLYNETSQGFSDVILNQAIDDLAQEQGTLKTRWIETKVPTLPTPHPLTIRLYYVNRESCPRVP